MVRAWPEHGQIMEGPTYEAALVLQDSKTLANS
jgi:hypothetical protein